MSDTFKLAKTMVDSARLIEAMLSTAPDGSPTDPTMPDIRMRKGYVSTAHISGNGQLIITLEHEDDVTICEIVVTSKRKRTQ